MSSAENKSAGETSEPPFEAAKLLEQIAAPWNTLAGMWNAWFEASRSLSGERGVEVGKSLTRLFDPELWKTGGLAPLLEELQYVLTLPKFADVPSLEFSMLHSSAAMLDLFGLVQQYMKLSIPMWAAACQRFQAEVAERAQRGERVRSPGEALDLWNGVLDRTLMEFNRSGEFARIQQRLLRASARHRLELRKIGERSAQLFDMPTREEMTDLYRRMHEMQREIHKLRREVRVLRNGSSSVSDQRRQSGNLGC
jgi:hypothetical protein